MIAQCGGLTLLAWQTTSISEEDRNERKASLAKMKKEGQKPAMHILCHSEALNNARVLQTETAMMLGELVSTAAPTAVPTELAESMIAAMPDQSQYDVDDANSVAILLTKNVLYDVNTLISLYQACVLGKTIIPVCVIGRGYDYRVAPLHLADLKEGLGKAKSFQLQTRLQTEMDAEGKPATLAKLQSALASTLPRIIAVNWEPEAGKNQLSAAVTNIVARLERKRESVKMPMLNMGGLFGSSGKDQASPQKSGRSERSEGASFRKKRNSFTEGDKNGDKTPAGDKTPKPKARRNSFTDKPSPPPKTSPASSSTKDVAKHGPAALGYPPPDFAPGMVVTVARKYGAPAVAVVKSYDEETKKYSLSMGENGEGATIMAESEQLTLYDKAEFILEPGSVVTVARKYGAPVAAQVKSYDRATRKYSLNIGEGGEGAPIMATADQLTPYDSPGGEPKQEDTMQIV